MTQSHQAGLSLLELLIAMVLSVALLSGVITMFTSSKGTYEINNRLARVEETGRFAMVSMVNPIRNAGYFGCTSQLGSGVVPVSTLNAVPGYSLASALMDYAVMAFDYSGPGTWSPALDTGFVTSPANQGDVLVVHYPMPDSSMLTLTANMATPTDDIQIPSFAAASAPFKVNQVLMLASCTARSVFQITGYDPVGGIIQHNVLAPAVDGSYLGNSTADLQTTFKAAGNYKEGGPGTIVAMQSIVFYLRASGSGNGTSLWRRVDTNAPEELVEGVDAMEIKLGFDSNNDGLVDQYLDPSDAAVIANPTRAISVAISLLVSSVDQYGTIDADTKAYDLFNDGTTDFTAPGDHRLRQVFTTTAALRNYAL